MSSLDDLRKQYPIFSYDQYGWHWEGETLVLEFNYSLSTDYKFKHTISIHNISTSEFETTSSETFKSLVFSLGMVEMLSYWKTTCSPQIQINAGSLTTHQANWWKKLLLFGMGEFFYVNNIDFSLPGFVSITGKLDNSESGKLELSSISNHRVSKLPSFQVPQSPSILVPIGGGKDSIVTLELLKEIQKANPPIQLATLVINPTQASKDVLKLSNVSIGIAVDRELDPLLYRMNQEAFLNGHIPISAVFAFISQVVATLKQFDAIALSNESSSNEGNIEFHGQVINHQYSKTFEFEKDFREYCYLYLKDKQSNKMPYYFSYLRPIYELQIAGIFAKFSAYHQIFRSCNRGQKTNSWCGDCPKCLFAYLILYPYLDYEYLVSIFGKDVFENQNLKETALELVNYGQNKPLECVGIYEESLVAFYLSIKKTEADKRPLPFILRLIKDEVLTKEDNLVQRTEQVLKSWNDQHRVPNQLIEPLRMAAEQLTIPYDYQ